MRPFWRLSLPILIAMAACVVAAEAKAEPGRVLRSDNRELGWSIRLNADCKSTICASLTHSVLTQNSADPTMCVVNPELLMRLGAVFPKWRLENYREHLSEIKASVLSRFFGNEEVMQHLQRDMPKSSLPQLREELWKRYGTEITALFARGDAKYQSANIDIDNDGNPEEVYRVSLVDWNDGIPLHWNVRVCDKSFPVPQYRIHLRGSAEELAAGHESRLAEELGSGYEFLQWHGTSLFIHATPGGASLSEIQSSGIGEYRPPQKHLWWQAVFGDEQPAKPVSSHRH
jgi:hypothetical protein